MRTRNRRDVLGVEIEHRLTRQRKPVLIPTCLVIPERRPDVAIVTHDELVQVARRAGYRRNLLESEIEHRLTRQRKPVLTPATLIIPKRRPDVAVITNDKQIQVTGRTGYRCNLLDRAIKHRLTR